MRGFEFRIDFDELAERVRRTVAMANHNAAPTGCMRDDKPEQGVIAWEESLDPVLLRKQAVGECRRLRRIAAAWLSREQGQEDAEGITFRLRYAPSPIARELPEMFARYLTTRLMLTKLDADLSLTGLHALYSAMDEAQLDELRQTMLILEYEQS